MRELAFDTETTGLGNDDQVIEIGAVEIFDLALTGRKFHTYVKPTCRVHPEALKVHGITDFFLRDKPAFIDVVGDFLKFVGNDRLVAHNASFDLKMINAELARLGREPLKNESVDTLPLARRAKPSGKHKLDDMLRYFKIDAKRDLHGALLDSELLAEVYIHLRGGRQTSLDVTAVHGFHEYIAPKPRSVPLPSRLTQEEILRHHGMIQSLGPESVWLLYPEYCKFESVQTHR